MQEDTGAACAVCSNCRTTTLFNLSPRITTGLRPDGVNDALRNVKRQDPPPALREYPAQAVPEPIARRFRDTQRAMQRELWEQAISTARTAVQVMARLEGVERGTLYQEIERLIDKRGAELPELVKTMAHKIRDAGNDALHPDDPEWEPSREEAQEALSLLQAVIEWLYAMPSRLKAPDEDAPAGELAEGSSAA